MLILAVQIACVGEASADDDRTSRNSVLADAELRFQSHYEKRDFASAAFLGKWLADSSGYQMLEPAKPGEAPQVVQYDVQNGKRSVLIGADQLVVPGSKQRLFVLRCIPTPVDHKHGLETRTGIWLFASKSGECLRLPGGVPFGLSADAFSPRVDRVVVRRGRNLAAVEIATGKITPLIELGKRFDYMAYPHHDHGLREGPGTAVHLRMLMTRYLIEHLPPRSLLTESAVPCGDVRWRRKFPSSQNGFPDSNTP